MLIEGIDWRIGYYSITLSVKEYREKNSEEDMLSRTNNNSSTEVPPPALPPRKGRVQTTPARDSLPELPPPSTRVKDEVFLPVKNNAQANFSYLDIVKERCKLGFGKVHGELLQVKHRLKTKGKAWIEKLETTNASSRTSPSGTNGAVLDKRRKQKCEENPTPLRKTRSQPSFPPINQAQYNAAERQSQDKRKSGGYLKVVVTREEHVSKFTKNADSFNEQHIYDEVEEQCVYEDVSDALEGDADNDRISSSAKVVEKSVSRSATPRESFYEINDSVPDMTQVMTLGEVHKGKDSVKFFSYSVKELTGCLKTCGLDTLSKVCANESLDGAFLKSMVVLDLRDGPFNLDSYQINKLHKIIEGWRPLLD